MWWNDSIDAATLSWASITPFGVPVVPLVKMSWNTSSGSGRFQAAWRASQSGGKSGSSAAGSAESASTVVVGKSARPAAAGSGRVTTRSQDQVAGSRCADDGGDRVHRHPQVERHDHEAGVHRPEVGGRQLRARRAPGQDPIAGLQVERPEPPGGDPRAAIEIAVRPVRARAIVRPQAKRRPIAEAGHGALEQVDQGHRHVTESSGGSSNATTTPSGRSRDTAERRSGRSKRASGAFDPPGALG